jgi:hypothetical protein
LNQITKPIAIVLIKDSLQKQSDADLIKVTKEGKGKMMPKYDGKLTDDKIKDLIKFIRKMGK